MAVTTITAGAEAPSMPHWLLSFERRRIAPAQRHTLAAAGQVALVIVIDGVVWRDDESAGLNRALPGEVICAAGVDALAYSNGSKTDELRVCQWIVDGAVRGPGTVDQRYFPDDDKRGALCLIASADGEGDALAHGGHSRAYLASLGKRESVLHNPAAGSSNWLHVLDGRASVGGIELGAGDCAWLRDEEELRLAGVAPAQLLLLEGPDKAGE